ncbi:hypothetical protein ACFSWD_31060 [Paenibacillus xanthanilyticus]
MNEKGAAAIADAFSMVPSGCSHRINEAMTLVTDDRAGLERALGLLQDLTRETGKLVSVMED